MTAEASRNQALEKLNQGIQESRRTAQQQTMELAQEYFDDSVEELRQQALDRRATLENLPDQVPGGYEESFQARFEQLMQKFSRLEACLADVRDDEPVAETSVAETTSGRKKEVDATDAARREAKKLGIDLTQVEGTGAGGRIVVWDVTELVGGESADQTDQAEQVEENTAGRVVGRAQKTGRAATQGSRATDAARRKAKEAGIDLSEVEGTGSGGNITVNDVTSLAESSKDQATKGAGQAAQAARDTAEQVTQQAQAAVGQAGGQVGQIARQAQQAAGETAEKATDQVQDATDGGSEEPKATNAARRKAEEMGVDLTEVEGTGSGGLITLKDVTDS
jgi:pyruvate/2-oxoglutarate dehydrogenase complex dihydrolipoamide acyltransferase (E2) component